MSFWQSLINGGDLVKSVGDTLDQLVTSDEEELALKNELAKAELQFKQKIAELDTSIALGQVQVNVAEARTGNLFIAGWRPAIGWIGVICLFYNFVLFPVLKTFYPDLNEPQSADVLWTMVIGMLGIGGFRSFDKLMKVDTQKIMAPRNTK